MRARFFRIRVAFALARVLRVPIAIDYARLANGISPNRSGS